MLRVFNENEFFRYTCNAYMFIENAIRKRYFNKFEKIKNISVLILQHFFTGLGLNQCQS